MLLPSQPSVFPRRPVIPEEWIALGGEDANARVRLLYVAGAGDARPWPSPPPGATLLVARLPGGRLRPGEPAYTRVGPLAVALADALTSRRDSPLALWGAGAGALVAFELARELRRRAAPPVTALVVTGCGAPDAAHRHANGVGSPADHELVRTYQYIDEAPLPCPILVLDGDAGTRGWRRHTSAAFSHGARVDALAPHLPVGDAAGAHR